VGWAASILGPGSRVGAGVGNLAVENFRSPGKDDRSVVLSALQAWSATGGELHFETNRHYDLGDLRTGEAALPITDMSNATIIGNGATLSCRSLAGQTHLFLIRRCQGLALNGLNATDRGVRLDRDWQGMNFVHIDGSAGPTRQVEIKEVTVRGAVSLLTVSGQTPDGQRTSGITLRRCSAINCYYGANFQENGDDALIELIAENCRRAYFPYGVDNHDVKLEVIADDSCVGANACILIKTYTRDTNNIRVQANFRGSNRWIYMVKLENQQQPNRVQHIQGVVVTIKIARGVMLNGAELAWAPPLLEPQHTGEVRLSHANKICIVGNFGLLWPHVATIVRNAGQTAEITIEDIYRGNRRKSTNKRGSQLLSNGNHLAVTTAA
jgi:hypothetical protein